VTKLTVVIIEAYHCYQLHIISNIILFKVHVPTKLLGIINVDFDVKDQPLIIYFVFFRYWRKNGNLVG